MRRFLNQQLIRWFIGIFILAAAAGCSSLPGSPNEAAPPAAEAPPTTEPASPEPTQEDKAEADRRTTPFEDVFEYPGRIAVVGNDFNLYILEHGAEPIQISTDGEPTRSRFQNLKYDHPTWSPNGWLSYARTDALYDGSVDVLALPPGEVEPVTLLSSSVEESGYIYGYWSPATCPTGEDCAQFAYLMGTTDGVALHLTEVTDSTDTPATTILSDSSRSLYYSWSPDGQSMLWNRDSSELSVFDLATGTQGDVLQTVPGLFQAPSWSPVDDRFLVARYEPEANLNTVSVLQGSQRTDLTSPFTGIVFFSWSPDGEQVAFSRGEDYPLGPITVMNADGSNVRLIGELLNTVAFFWSPDGSKLAALSVETVSPEFLDDAPDVAAKPAPQDTPPPRTHLVWYVIDVESGTPTRLDSFLPTTEQIYLLRYFDQYAQSHRVWSPDSRYIVYSGVQQQFDPPSIYLLDTEFPEHPAVTLFEGVSAVFSFQ